MIVRRIMLTVGVCALMSTPAWADPGNGQSKHPNDGNSQGGAPGVTANPGEHGKGDHGKGNNGDHGNGRHKNQNAGNDNQGNGHKGKSHKCVPHAVAYVASGTLVSQTLAPNADGTYSGEVVAMITHTNRHAAGDVNTTVTYKVTDIRVGFGNVKDTNHDGSVGPDDLLAGEKVHVLGKITVLGKKCNQTGFTPEKTVRRIVFHVPHVKG